MTDDTLLDFLDSSEFSEITMVSQSPVPRSTQIIGNEVTKVKITPGTRPAPVPLPPLPWFATKKSIDKYLQFISFYLACGKSLIEAIYFAEQDSRKEWMLHA